jgi:hypothetical protein
MTAAWRRAADGEHDRVRTLALLTIALALCVLYHARLAGSAVAPDLPLALAAWAMVDGDDEGVVFRAWAIGVVRDLIDPGSVWFHAACGLALGMAMVPVRRMLFRTRWAAWGGMGVAASAFVQVCDVVVSGAGGRPWWQPLAVALLTGLAAVALGWLMAALPKDLRLVREAGA